MSFSLVTLPMWAWVVGRLVQANDMLANAVQANPGEWRLHMALAETARLLERHDIARRHVLAALGMVPVTANQAPSPAAHRAENHGDLVIQALVATAFLLLGLIGAFQLRRASR